MKTIITNLSFAIIVVFTIQVNSSAQKAGFTINGQVTGLKDNTKIYLRNAKPEKIIDSAIVIGGKFMMRGRITEQARQVALFTARYENYVFFWIENKPMSVALKAGEFKKAIIKGSGIQDEYNKLLNTGTQLELKQDSLKKILLKTNTATERESLSSQLSALSNEAKQLEPDYIKQHPNSLISAYLLSASTSIWGKKKVASLYKTLSPAMKNTNFW